MRNQRQQAKMLRQKDGRICWDKKSEATLLEQKIQHEQINQMVLAKERTLKKISLQVQTIQIKQDIPKLWKKVLPTNRLGMNADLQTTGYKEKKTILEQNMGAERS